MWANALRASAKRVAAETSPVRVELGEHARVVGRIDDHRDALVVLGRRADHRRAADVDVLDHLVERRAARDRLAERVEVHDHQIDGDEPGLLHLGAVLRRRPAEEAAVHARVQRLDAAVEDLGRAGEVAHLAHRDARLGRAPCAVPPVERISRPAADSPRARSTTPVLSETEISAREIFASLVRHGAAFYH